MSVEQNKLQADWKDTQGSLSLNDASLGTKKGELSDAEGLKAGAEAFLAQLTMMCASKAKVYEKRVMLRANEEAAISQAIAILNNDAAFTTFGTVTATSGKFIQLSAVRRHVQKHDHVEVADSSAKRQEAQNFLRRAAGSQRSLMLSKIAALLEAENPFTVVLEEIKKMIALLQEEDQADDEQFNWCNSERTTNNNNLDAKNLQIQQLEGQIQELETLIDDPLTGLKKVIADDEAALAKNREDQATTTKQRTEANALYQTDIANLVEASTILEKAIKVLKVYYHDVIMQDEPAQEYPSAEKVCEGHGYVEAQCVAFGCCEFEGVNCYSARGAGPCPPVEGLQAPETWEPGYKGQKEGGAAGPAEGGTAAIELLEYILGETKKEEEAAHALELEAQSEYEDEMNRLTKEEGQLEQSIKDNKAELAAKEAELLAKREDLKTTTAEKDAIKAYLAKIKPGCDFITQNIETRKSNRLAEKAALDKAAELIEGTPAYQEAVAVAHNETLALKDCQDLCACPGDLTDACPKKDHVDCKACMAGVTIPGYCAGHPDTHGCP